MFDHVLEGHHNQTRTLRSARAFSIGLFSTLALSFVFTEPATAAPQQQVGITAAVKGDVRLSSPDTQEVRAARSGDGVYFKERIQSGKDSTLQLLLLDETTFTLGADADIVIDEMVYDPASQDEGRLVVNVSKGVFRYISGDIAKRNPKTVSIETPLVSVGIRGTSFFAASNPDGGGWFFGLLGPGPDNNTGDAPGGIVVENNQGSTFIRRAGYGVSVSPGKGPSAPIAIPADVINRFQASVGQAADPNAGKPAAETTTAEGAPAPGQPAPDEGAPALQVAGASAPDGKLDGDFSATDLAGQTTVEGVSAVRIQKKAEGVITHIKNQGDEQTQTSTKAYDFRPHYYDQVRTFKGTGTYNQEAIPMYAGSFPTGGAGLSADVIQEAFRSLSGPVVGRYDVAMSVDFDNKTITGNYNAINVPSLSINNETVAISNNYLSDTGLFEKKLTKNIAGPYELETMITFLGGAGGPRPDMLSAISVQSDGTEQDHVIGANITPAQ